jgi:hypothetical protein
MTTSTTAPLAASSDPRALRVVSILASGLPATLRTPDEPSLYTVPAVVSRQVTAQERARIEDPETARLLAAEVGLAPGLELSVSDRRLLIGNTTLTQLDQGLAAAIGRMLVRLEDELLEAKDVRDQAAAEHQSDELERLAAIAHQAEQIRFGPAPPEGDVRPT